MLLPWDCPSLQSAINAVARALLVRLSLYGLEAFAPAPEVFAATPFRTEIHPSFTLSWAWVPSGVSSRNLAAVI
jgi:hypothetical protein